MTKPTLWRTDLRSVSASPVLSKTNGLTLTTWIQRINMSYIFEYYTVPGLNMTWEVTIMNNPGVRKRNLHPGVGRLRAKLATTTIVRISPTFLRGFFVFFDLQLYDRQSYYQLLQGRSQVMINGCLLHGHWEGPWTPPGSIDPGVSAQHS